MHRPFAGAVAFAIAAASFAGSGCRGETEAPKSADAAYADTCALCHGAHGEGYAADNAPALANQELLAAATDHFLARSIARGRPGTTMSAWDTAHGGPYDVTAIDGLVQYVRKWQTVPAVVVDTVKVEGGDAGRGANVYATTCASCHGPTGQEGPYVHLANPELLATASDGFLQRAIQKGRPGTQMQAYEGTLDAQSIADLVALLRSWQKPIVEGDIPVPGTLGPVVVNPGGPAPEFTPGQRYTPMATVKAELDRGAAMVLLDARAPSDYVGGHITHAVDVPFYDVANQLDALPRDQWIVCYCGCPHAESGRAADALMGAGFSKVTVLDEGYYGWKNAGYPTSTGPGPDP